MSDVLVVLVEIDVLLFLSGFSSVTGWLVDKLGI